MKFVVRAALCLFLSHVVSHGAVAADAAAATQTTYPLKIEDDLDRVVSFPSRPERIVSVGPSTTEMLFAIGVADRIVGIDGYSDFPPETAEIAKIGGMVNPSIERIMELKPDVVFLPGFASGPVDRLTVLGLRVVVVGPQDIDQVYGTLKLLGWIMDAREEAAEAVAAMQAGIDRVTRVVGDLPDEERTVVFYELGHELLWTAGPGSFVHEAILLAGGLNAAADVPTAWSSFSVESLLLRDPDAILVTQEESYDAIVEGRRPQWRSLRAVQSKRVYLIDGDAMNRPGPRLQVAIESLARLLYPDLFPADASDADADADTQPDGVSGE
jgi:iron complex transport system substrate-binding protein